VTFYVIAALVLGVPLALWAVHSIADRRELQKNRWTGTQPHPKSIAFLNAGLAIRPTVLGHDVPIGYRQACRFFGVGLIDRTGTLDHGFVPQIIDPVPNEFSNVPDMAHLCADRAAKIVAEARETDQSIRLLWSGGIDSTCVAAALLTALGDDTGLLEVAYSNESVAEYRKFFRMLKKRGIRLTKIKHVSEALTPDALIVTGEHGDQIFGSMLAENIPFPELQRPWREVMPGHIAAKIGEEGARDMLQWMQPQLSACPVPLVTTYDFLWWANFSMKWQTVSQRVLATLETAIERKAVAPLLRHFFRTEDFQRWALANPDQKIRNDWPSYKYALKDIIFDFNGDKRYRKNKIKERSLRGLTGRLARRAIAIDADGVMHSQPTDRSIIPRAERWSFEISRDWE